MDILYIIGLLATIALFAPVFFLTLFRLFRFRVYLALLIYCFLAFAYSLMTLDVINVPIEVETFIGLANNLVDVPLMMTFFILFATSARQKNWMKRLTLVYIVFEVVVLLVMQKLDRDTIAVTYGPGLAMVIFFGLTFFIHRIKIANTYHKAYGKAILISALIFAYGCFSFIYVIHFLLQIKAPEETFLIYNLVSILYNATLSIGIIIENKRIRKLEEVFTTRRELSEVFSEDRNSIKKAAPKKETAEYWRYN